MNYESKVDIGGQERIVNLSVLAVGEIFKDLEVDVVGLGKLIAMNNHLILVPTIIYHGLKADVKSKGGIVDFSKEQVAAWCLEKEDGVFDEGLQSVYSSFIDSVYSFFPALKRISEEEEKGDGVKKN